MLTFKEAFRKLQDRVNNTRALAADLAESFGAPEIVTSTLRPIGRASAAPDAPPPPRPTPTPPTTTTAEPTAEAHPEVRPATAPGAATVDDAAFLREVQGVLDDLINPAIAAHGGYISLVEVKDNKVFVQMGGGCQGCGAASLTLKAGVERMLKEELPAIDEVIDVTDHALGENPFYSMEK